MYSLDCLNIYLGWQCNLHCKHCWVSADNTEAQGLKRVDISLILESIKEAIPLGLKMIKISGGEPFLFPEDMYRIIELANGFGLDVNIESNGTIFQENVIELLDPEKSYINVSLDGYEENVHNEMRGNQEAFQKTVQGLAFLQKRGLSFGVTYTIHDGNVEKIDSMIDFLGNKAVAELKLNPILAIGRARKEAREFPFLLTLENLVEVYEKYNNYKKNGVHVRIMVSPCFIKPFQMLTGQKQVCACNYVSMLSILPDGKVGLCGEAKDIEEFCFGNICEDTIRTIWNNSGNLNKMREETEDIQGVCRECNYNRICRGGCRIAAYLYGNTINSPNPVADTYYKKNGCLPYKSARGK